MNNQIFTCGNCSRKMTFFKILKLSFGRQGNIKFTCVCGSMLKFKENLFFRYLPAFIGAGIVLIPKTFISIFIWIILAITSIVLYFVTLTR